MKKPLMLAVSGLAGVTATGVAVSVLAWPAQAGGETKVAVKREQDTPDIVLVADDDDPDGDDLRARAADDDTNATNEDTRTANTANTANTRSDRSRTGNRSGRDNSRTGRAKVDWTNDGPGPKTRDWSRNHTNDRSRNNTRG
ncbi:hypothetical protein [Nocardioides sp. L-11A]|uniref:hypothetical protein n=1 Tax=Nocardioides sp. L-11A TaxID=3043848 RepID=UPI00249A790D|nr:hypothetical protein QJ852_11420 [Nocardioides sp. L-11A]